MAGKVAEVLISMTLIVTISYVYTGANDVSFGPADLPKHLPIFEGENVSLICSVTDANITNEVIIFAFTFRLKSRSSEKRDVVVIDQRRPQLENSQFQIISQREVRFVIRSVSAANEGWYICDPKSSERYLQSADYHLDVATTANVQCSTNSTHSFLSTGVLQLSCFFKTQTFPQSEFMWLRTDSDGTESILESNTTKVNNIRSKLVSYVRPSETISEWNYSCGLNGTMEGVMDKFIPKCNVGPFIVSNKKLVTFSPNIQKMSPGNVSNVSCLLVDDISMVTPEIIRLWDIEQHMLADVNLTKINNTLLQIAVRESAADGATFTVNCKVISSEPPIFYPLTIVIDATMVVTTSNVSEMNVAGSDLNTSSLAIESQSSMQRPYFVGFIVVSSLLGITTILLLMMTSYILVQRRQRQTQSNTEERRQRHVTETVDNANSDLVTSNLTGLNDYLSIKSGEYSYPMLDLQVPHKYSRQLYI